MANKPGWYRTKPVRWNDICRVLQMFGYMDGEGGKGESFRINAKLKELIEAGVVVQVRRGLYRLAD